MPSVLIRKKIVFVVHMPRVVMGIHRKVFRCSGTSMTLFCGGENEKKIRLCGKIDDGNCEKREQK